MEKSWLFAVFLVLLIPLSLAQADNQVAKLISEDENSTVDFEVGLSIPEEFQTINPGDILPLEVTITSLGREGVGGMQYVLKDLADNVWFIETESVQIQNQTYSRNIVIPDELNEGEYLLYAQLSFEDSVSVASVPLFNVILGTPTLALANRGLIIVLLVALMIIVLWLAISKLFEDKLIKSFRELIMMAKARRSLKKYDVLRFENLRLNSRR